MEELYNTGMDEVSKFHSMMAYADVGRRRNDLTLADKVTIITLYTEGHKTQTEIAKQFNCSQSQVSRAVKRRHEIYAEFEDNTNSRKKRQRYGRGLVEQFLGEKQQLFDDKKISEVIPSADEASPTDKDSSLKIESACSLPNDNEPLVAEKEFDADLRCRIILRQVLTDYMPEQIFNCVETGLYYKELPDSIMSSKDGAASPEETAREKVTLLVACNMTGTEKLPLLVIGKKKKPICLRGVPFLPVEYEANAECLMTGSIFQNWLVGLNRYMRHQGRKIVLIMERCSAHIPDPSVGKLPYVTTVLLPANTVACFKPCELGIIDNLKVQYRTSLLKRAMISTEDSSVASLHSAIKTLTLLDAIHILVKAWADVKRGTIERAFRKACFKNPDSFGEDENGDDYYGRVLEDGIADVEGENDKIIDNDKREASDETETDSTVDNEDESISMPSVEEAMKACQVIRNMLILNGQRNMDDFYSAEQQVLDACCHQAQIQLTAKEAEMSSKDKFITDNSVTDNGLSENSASNELATDNSVCDNGIIDKSVTNKSAAGNSVTDNALNNKTIDFESSV